MKRLLATTAVALVATAGAASAQSVLERVLAQTTALGEVTGIFSNSADNIGASGFGTTTTEEVAVTVAAGDVITVDDGGPVTGTVQADGSLVDADGNTIPDITVQIGAQLFRDTDGTNTVADSSLTGAAGATGLGGATAVFQTVTTDNTQFGINGSITNVANRIDTATANVENQVTAIDSVTANFGNMSTTVLGAVNTGEIGLGTNQDVQEAISGTSEAVKSLVTQVGTQTGQTVLALNSALNTMGINGSISNTFEGVNASVAAISPDVLEIVADANGAITLTGVDQLLGTMSTTVLGAVNTGTIVSGVNNQVTGTVASITGNSATNMFGE